jgi:hypothetical protein
MVPLAALLPLGILSVPRSNPIVSLNYLINMSALSPPSTNSFRSGSESESAGGGLLFSWSSLLRKVYLLIRFET